MDTTRAELVKAAVDRLQQGAIAIGQRDIEAGDPYRNLMYSEDVEFVANWIDGQISLMRDAVAWAKEVYGQDVEDWPQFLIDANHEVTP